MPTTESITKLEAAERQLRVAIQLFFEQADLVAVSTLTFAAGQVLRDLGRHRGILSPIRDSDLIRPERKKEFIDALNRAPNFFKHADRDPNETLEFRPDVVPYELFEGVIMFRQLGQLWSPEMLVFASWFFLKFPAMLKPGELADSAHSILSSGFDLDDFSTLRELVRRTRKEEAAKQSIK